VLDTLVAIRGGERIRLRGLELAEGSPRGSDRQMPWNHIGGGAIRVEGGRVIALCANRIRGVGVGIALLGVEDAQITGNRIGETAGNGIYLGMAWGGRPSRRVRIEGNRLAEIGHRFADSAGILLQGVEDVAVVDNRIERTAQFGIYAMQSRPNGEDRIRKVRIERNRIHAANLRSADGGGIKLFAAVQDEPMAVRLRANWISGTTHLMAGPDGRFFAPEDFDGRRWPQPIAPAIYLDWYASGVVVEGNLSIHDYAGISIVNGSDNRITGNVVIGPVGAALGVDDKTPNTPGRPAMAGNRFEANIVLLERPGSLAVQIWDLAEKPGAAFAGNLYGGPALGAGSFVAGPGRLPGGRREADLGLWARSRYVAGPEHGGEPGFRDRTTLDLRLDPRGLAARLGIRPLDPWLLERAHGGR
ncbi:MAG: right-handed parallel beta-helix repeat-containing protein, partial [Geminicoccaceae bacterium]|nr:right-handed parallel beta-helix repeat-containing protein [Geminicoccaceae bacterium]